MFYIIVTTCINNKVGIKHELIRKDRYIKCITNIVELTKNEEDIKVIVVENNGKRETYLDNLGCDVIYTSNNSLNFPNKGMNELLDIKHVIKTYNISDEDFIFKLTGRYKVLNLDLINLVKRLSDRFEAFVKFFNVCTLKFHENKDDCVLGYFAIKCKYLKMFEYCKNGNISGESDFALFVRNNVNNIFGVRNLSLECCFADDLRILSV
jgi:hypothetical protein